MQAAARSPARQCASAGWRAGWWSSRRAKSVSSQAWFSAIKAAEGAAVMINGFGDADALALPARQVHAALTDRCVEPAGQTCRELRHEGQIGRPAHRGVGGALLSASSYLMMSPPEQRPDDV